MEQRFSLPPTHRQQPLSPAAMALSISKVTFENNQPALGIGTSQPRISWRFDGTAEAWEQQSYDLEISRPGGAAPQQTTVNTAMIPHKSL